MKGMGDGKLPAIRYDFTIVDVQKDRAAKHVHQQHIAYLSWDQDKMHVCVLL